MANYHRKVEFIANQDPNIIKFISTTMHCVAILKKRRHFMNDTIDEIRQRKTSNRYDNQNMNFYRDMKYVYCLLIFFKNNLDLQLILHSILVYKSIELLITAGRDIFRTEMGMMSVTTLNAENPLGTQKNPHKNCKKKKTPFTAFMEKIRGQKVASQKDNTPDHAPNTPEGVPEKMER